MAALKKRSYSTGSFQRVSPLKPGLRGTKNWMAAQVRAAGHTRKGMVRFVTSAVLLLLMAVIFALWLGGYLPQVRQGVSDFKRDRLMAMGFVVEQVDVMGEGRMNEADVRAVIGIYPGDYFFGADLETAQARTESLPWVDRAVVRRLWPNRIVVQLVETEPYALWQKDGQISLVSAEGEVISALEDAPSFPPGLRVITGEQAPKQAAAFQSVVQAYPEIWARTEGMVYLNNGRWDLHLKGDIQVKLPKEGAQNSLAQLIALHNRNMILDRQIGIIDLRLPDRLTLRPQEPNGSQKGA